MTIPVSLPGLPVRIHGTLCHPGPLDRPGPVEVLTSGATYNSDYWFGEGVGAASFVAQASRLGATTLAIDPIGTGGSTRPVSTLVSTAAQAAMLHVLVGDLRQGRIDGVRHPSVSVVGHSLGSIDSLSEAATYQDVTAVVLTGFTHLANPTVLQHTLATATVVANTQAEFATLDAGYITTKPGVRESLFDNPSDIDPAVARHDEIHRDVVSTTELTDGTPVALDPSVSRHLGAIPVLEADGGDDQFFCGPGTGGCPTSAALYQQEAADFTGPFATDVVPDAGHDLSLPRDGYQATDAIDVFAG